MPAALLLGSAACKPQPTAALTPQNGVVKLPMEQVAALGLQVVPVGRSSAGAALQVGGRIGFADTRVSHIFSPVSGRVLRLDAKLGQQVQVGTALAQLESPDVGQASSDLAKARADLTAAQADQVRQKSLYSSGAAAQRDYEAAQDNFDRARAEFARAEKKEQLLSRQGDKTHQQYVLRSQINGEVLARSVNLGVEVQGQYSGGNATELFTVADLSEVWVLSDVYEADLSRVQRGQSVQVAVEALPGQTFTGQVEWLADVLDPTSHTAKMRCTVPNPKGLLKPDMFATVSVATVAKKIVAVPRRSLLKLGDKYMVFVQQPADSGALQFVRRPVIIDEEGADDPEQVPVVHGLHEGELIAVQGAQKLMDMLTNG
jgi:cobalt-zinc-cadmium efflux system membrane fusion protein